MGFFSFEGFIENLTQKTNENTHRWEKHIPHSETCDNLELIGIPYYS